MQKIINNLAIEYSDEGSGPIILMLHGWGDNLHTFDRLISDLQEDYRIIRVDLPGFGNSEEPEEPWELNDYVNFVSDFIEKLDIEVNTFLGHSFGGRIIIKGSAKKILESERNILISSAGIYKSAKTKNILIKLIAKIGKLITFIPPFIFYRKKIKDKFYKNIQSDYNQAKGMRQTFLNVIKEDLKKYAKKIKTPTLLIWGEDDSVTPVKDGEKLNKLIKKSDLKIIKKSGHFVHQEKPERITELIKTFNA